MEALRRKTAEACPNVPYFLLGHAMGSFMVRSMLIKYPKMELTAAILSGTGWMHRGIINTGIASATMVCKLEGAQSHSKRLNAMLYAGYNRRVEHKRTEFDWLTRDSKAIAAYIADPLCGFTATAGLIRDMLTAMRDNQELENLKKMRKNLPILFVAGNEDPMGGYGEGVIRSAAEFEKAGMQHVDMRLFPLCRHEVLNEINKEEVYAYLLRWLQEHVHHE